MGWSGTIGGCDGSCEETKKGARDVCPSFLGCARGTPPPRTHLTQRCYYNNLLRRGIAHSNFTFPLCPGQLAAPVISRGPDLGQEILVTVTVENQLGRLLRLCRFAIVRQESLYGFPVGALGGH